MRSLLLLLLWAVPGTGLLRQGITLYERGDYVAARSRLADAMAFEHLGTKDLATARVYLAASCLVLGDEPSARRALTLLVRDDPSFEVDPVLFPEHLVTLAEEIRVAQAAPKLRSPKPPDLAPDSIERPPPPHPTAKAESVLRAPPGRRTVVSQRVSPSWPRWLPAAVGTLALGAGAYLLLQSGREVSALNEGSGTLSVPGAVSAYHRGLSDEAWGYPLAVAGLAGWGTTGALLLLAPAPGGSPSVGAGVRGTFP